MAEPSYLPKIVVVAVPDRVRPYHVDHEGLIKDALRSAGYVVREVRVEQDDQVVEEVSDE